MNHKFYMDKALELARQAAAADEIPVGALIVNPTDGEIIASAYNLSQHSLDATAHAEILAIQKACRKLNCNRLRGLDMYVTLEPCTMCAAAISFARIEHLYIGTEDTKGGAVLNGVKFYQQPTCHHRPIVESGFLQEECSQILKSFFQARRSGDRQPPTVSILP